MIPSFSLSSLPTSQVAAEVVLAPLWEGDAAGSTPAALDELLGGRLNELRAAGEFIGKSGECCWLHLPAGLPTRLLVLVGMGRQDNATARGVQEAVAAAFFDLTRKPRNSIAILEPSPHPVLDAAQLLLQLGLGASQGSYSGGLHQAKPTRTLPPQVILQGPPERLPLIDRLRVEAEAVARCRDLVNATPDELTPESFAQVALQYARDVNLNAESWSVERLTQEKMGGILGVGKGSDAPPRFVILRYQGKASAPWLALVGKGVTFDSGGMSMKTSEQMVDMKCDMAGAAAVLCATRAIAELALPVNILCCIPLAENMVSGRSMKLGDVLTARNGTTIEVLNTDAEGRLILADALAYAAEQKVAAMVDLATLTGACMVALGTEIAGAMSNSDRFRQEVLDAIARSGERAWPLPMDDDFNDLLKSKIADVKNVAGARYGGAITAAKFLERFVGGVPWVHLDIAGPAYGDHDAGHREAGGTGAFVRSLIQLARDWAAAHGG